VTGQRRAFVPDEVATFTCDRATGGDAGSIADDDSGPYAKMLAWFRGRRGPQVRSQREFAAATPQLKRDRLYQPSD